VPALPGLLGQEAPDVNVSDVRDGKGIRIRGYLDVESAVEAAERGD
jgi:hypothetical protein